VSLYQKGKTNLDLLEQETVSGSGINWALCKSAPNPRHTHTSTPPVSFYKPDALLLLSQQRQSAYTNYDQC